jgi:hypothetical protein
LEATASVWGESDDVIEQGVNFVGGENAATDQEPKT